MLAASTFILEKISSIWYRLFLEERPALGLSLFRLAVAFTTGAHVIPTLLHLEDNYLHTAFQEKNLSFFTPDAIAWAGQSPDWLVHTVAVLFYVALFFFAAGLFSQASCILMTACCYYFYALNSLHIGTLSLDILLVTLFLMCLTGYHGDYFSLDAVIGRLRGKERLKRPFFIQRLLQLQIASTYFYTALCKFTARGNWLIDNPIYYLLNSTPESVVKPFPLRNFFASSPDFCYAAGLAVILLELSVSFLLFVRAARPATILLAFGFHVMLVVTLHVPTIFFFLFPPQLLLFLEPETVLARLHSSWCPALWAGAEDCSTCPWLHATGRWRRRDTERCCFAKKHRAEPSLDKAGLKS